MVSEAQVVPRRHPRPEFRRETVFAWVLGLLGGAWLGVFPLISRFSYVAITQAKWNIAAVMAGVTLVIALVMLGLGLWRQVNWRNPGRWLMVGMFAWMVLSMLFGSASDTTNEQGNLTVWLGNGKRNEGMSTQLIYLTLLFCFSLKRPAMRPLLMVSALGMAAFFGVIVGQYVGFNVLGFYPGFPWYANMRITYEFQGTMGQIDMISGYLCLMTPLFLGAWVYHGGRDGWYLLPAGMMSMLLTWMIDVTSGKLALLACAGLLICLMVVKPAYRRRGLVVLGLLLVSFTLRQITGLPWLDGQAAPWCLPARADAPTLAQCTGDELVVFPWNVTFKKLLPALLGLGLVLLSPPLGKHPGRALRLRWVIVACALLLVLGTLFIALTPIPESAGTLWELHEVLNGRMQDSFGSERWGIWRYTLRIAGDNLLFGTGPDTFYAVMRDYIAVNGIGITQNFDNPHNLYLAVMMQNGLPALALMLAGLAVILLGARKRPGGFVLAGAVLGYLVQGIFVFSNIIVTPMFWVVLGMTAALNAPDVPSLPDTQAP